MQNHDALLAEQMAYYRARAPEYDEWFLRQGRYDRGPDANRQWFTEAGQVAAALEEFGPGGDVLELACGTGLWTQRLLGQAATLTAVEASAEMIALNRARVGEGRVRYIQSDIFSWRPDRRYDVVFFSFWLSHVPPERFAPFWRLVSACLAGGGDGCRDVCRVPGRRPGIRPDGRPGGRFFLIDSIYEPASIARDHRLEGPEATSVTRRLNDGSEYRIVKVFHSPEDLERRLAGLGLRATIRRTDNLFLYGWGSAADVAP